MSVQTAPAPPRHRKLPPAETLKAWRDKGLTNRQIVDRVEKRTGVRVTAKAVSVALGRAGIRDPQVRYSDLIPWKIRSEHANNYIAEMLRAAARHKRGLPLTPDKAQRLRRWIKSLRDSDCVVTYLDYTDQGFYFIPRDPTKDSPKALIRQPD